MQSINRAARRRSRRELANRPQWGNKLTDEEKHDLYSDFGREATAGFSTRAHLRATFTDLTARDPLNRVLEVSLLLGVWVALTLAIGSRIAVDIIGGTSGNNNFLPAVPVLESALTVTRDGVSGLPLQD